MLKYPNSVKETVMDQGTTAKISTYELFAQSTGRGDVTDWQQALPSMVRVHFFKKAFPPGEPIGERWVIEFPPEEAENVRASLTRILRDEGFFNEYLVLSAYDRHIDI